MTALSVLTADQARTRVETGDALLVDIREADEYARAHVPGSVLMPLSKLDGDRLRETLGDRSPLFLCASGARTEGSAARLAALIETEGAMLKGGLAAWQKSGGAVTMNKAAPLPIMRQVQIIAGSLVLLGVVLGLYVDPRFIGLSAFVGAGLLFAGLTGFCGMARMLAVMPWNKAPSQPSSVSQSGAGSS